MKNLHKSDFELSVKSICEYFPEYNEKISNYHMLTKAEIEDYI